MLGSRDYREDRVFHHSRGRRNKLWITDYRQNDIFTDLRGIENEEDQMRLPRKMEKSNISRYLMKVRLKKSTAQIAKTAILTVLKTDPLFLVTAKSKENAYFAVRMGHTVKLRKFIAGNRGRS